MKICNAEAMKMIKSLEKDLERIRLNEELNSVFSYKEGEQKILPEYDYAKARQEKEEINAKIRKIKHALAIANTVFKIDYFNITIGEALVYLAQLNNEYDELEELANRRKITRHITSNGVLEYTECTYEPEQVKQDRKEIYAQICKLQVAIDRANLNSEIEL